MIHAPERERIDRSYDRPPLRHYADADRNYEYALCGVYRSRPLDPTLPFKGNEQFCVVCLELYRMRGGRSAT